VPRTGEDRVLTVPNALSVGRLLCVPVFLWLLFGRDNRAAAAVLLGVLGATDWVDGYVARHFNQVSTIGKVLDPAADRVLIATAVIAMFVDGSVPVWVGVLTIVREAAVSLAVIGLAAIGARRIDVQWVGKAGTFLLMFAFPFFLVSESTVSWDALGRVLAWGCAIPGLVLSWYAAFAYIPLAHRALAEGRTTPTTEVPVP
jgi:cardiolipin synthase (CMP-forming)